jgi:hypothetical protein
VPTLKKENKNGIYFTICFFSGFVIVFLMLPVISSCAGNQKDIYQQTRLEPFEDDVILRAFELTHSAIIVQVRRGDLPEDVAIKADELRTALKKYLIKSEADLQILEVDVLHASAAE